MGLGRFVSRVRRIAAHAAILGMLLQLAIAATHHHGLALGGPATFAGGASFAAPLDDGQAPPADEGHCQVCLGLAFGTAFVLPAGITLDLSPAPHTAPGVAKRERETRTVVAFHSRAPPRTL